VSAYWPIADAEIAPRTVRFWVYSGHQDLEPQRQLLTLSGHARGVAFVPAKERNYFGRLSFLSCRRDKGIFCTVRNSPRTGPVKRRLGTFAFDFVNRQNSDPFLECVRILYDVKCRIKIINFAC
jgi:hypothetical protein